ncbi:hypothetical protein BD560DRAFT_443794 [Blakeslea trispora]|nr:hypothetical protein BD560DRAFT_443794 [Blakeslea trispora]
MDTSYSYPQLFDMDDALDAELIHGMQLQENSHLMSSNTNYNGFNSLYNIIDKKLIYQQYQNNVIPEDIYNSLASASNSYLQYTPHNQINHSTNYTHEYLYESAQHQQSIQQPMPMTNHNMHASVGLAEYDYLHHPQVFSNSHTQQQKQQYNWLYDPIDSFLPLQASFVTGDMVSQNTSAHPFYSESTMHENTHLDSSVTVEGGMSRGYVSLSDVNSFVAKADSAKHSYMCQLSSLPDNPNLDEIDLTPQSKGDFISSPESFNDDSEYDHSDDNSDHESRWPLLSDSPKYSPISSSSSSAIHSAMSNSFCKKQSYNPEKLMIKIKKPECEHQHAMSLSESHTMADASICNSVTSRGTRDYNGQGWDLISPKGPKSNSYRGSKYRKSMSNIYQMKKSSKLSGGKYESSLSLAAAAAASTKYRRGSAPNRMNSTTSSSSLSALSNNLQRSMRVSDSIGSFASSQLLSDEESHSHHGDLLDDHNHTGLYEEEEDDDDGEYQIRQANSNHALPTKKGRNVDKACNHCKRSHLRCDDMRPCRRCVATGRTGCKDVQHKPRGRPKLHKK